MSDFEDNSSSDEDEETTGYVKGRDSFIYVVDALLFKKEENFHEAINAIRESFLTGVISHPKELIGVVFHNTKNSPLPMDNSGMEDLIVLKNHCIFLPLKPLSKDIVCYFQEFCTNNYFDFEQKYGLERGSFQSLLRLCCNMFNNCRPKPGSQTIVYLTNQDLPHPEKSDEYNKSMVKANDLRDTNIDFEILPMCQDFNYDRFYKEFLCLVKGQDIDSFFEDSETKKEMFKTHQLAMNLKNKSAATLKWNLGDDLDISVGFYNLFSKSSYPKPVKIFRSDNSLINVKRVKELKYLDELGESSETRMLLPGEEIQTLKYLGKTIELTADEVAKLKTPVQPSLRLVGFIENDTIPIDCYVKPSCFMYPSEREILGSTKLFTAIWQKCLEMKKLAVCIFSKKRKSYPKFVVLQPESRIFSNHDGFNVFYLPSFDNIRNVDLREWETDKPTDEQISVFKSVIKKLRANYDYKMKAFTDPTLDYLNAKIIALAFDLETENLEDGLGPDQDEQDARMNLSVEDITNLFGEDDVVATKRTAKNAKDNDNAAKKVKTSSNDVNEQMILELVNRNGLSALSVVQLRTYLQSKGETGLSKLTKPLLIQKIMNLHS